MHWQKIALVGVGLLGGSLGLALRQRRLATRIEGYVRRAESIAECERLGVVDQAGLDLVAAVREADLVILCVPLAQMRGLAERFAPGLKPGAVVTDVGSVKASVVADLESLIAKAGGHFIGGHPMAGAEKIGVQWARADLFEQSVCVLTPTAKSSLEAVAAVEQLWRDLGARTMRLDAQRHDDLVARCSHLPHVAAAELASYVLSPVHPPEQAQLCAGGFRDTTRIAAGSPEMWRDIALANRQHLARVLGVFIEDLQEFQRALTEGNARVVEEFFFNAKQRRDGWAAQLAPASPE